MLDYYSEQSSSTQKTTSDPAFAGREEGAKLECYCRGFYALRELRLPKEFILSDRTLYRIVIKGSMNGIEVA